MLLSSALGALFLWLLFRWSGLSADELWSSWRRLSWSAALCALGLHALVYWTRSQRFRVLLPAATRPSGAAMLAISAAHNLAAYVLPAKTGEMMLVVYLRSHGGVPAAQGLAALLVSRLLDLAALCALLGVATAVLLAGGASPLPAWCWAVAAALLALGAAFLALGARGDLLVRAATWGARSVGLGRRPLAARLLARAEQLGLALREAPAGRALWIAAAQSVAMWIGIFCFYAVLARAFGLPAGLGLATVAFGSSLAVLTNLLPLNSFAGFGTQEGGWVLGFGLLGVARELALSTGLGVHLAQLASTVVLGLLGHAAMGALPRRAAPAPPAALDAGSSPVRPR